MKEADLRNEVTSGARLSPTLKSSLTLVQAITRLPVCIVCPAARWYKTENGSKVAELECFCTQFRGLMFQPPKMIVTDCDAYFDVVAQSSPATPAARHQPPHPGP